MSGDSFVSSVPSYRPPDEITLEAFVGEHRIETKITFTERVTVADFANIKVAFEAGIREGLLLAKKVFERDL